MMHRLSFIVFAFLFSLSTLACGSDGVGPIGTPSADDDVELASAGDAVESEQGDAEESADGGTEAGPSDAVESCWSGLQLCEGDAVKTCIDGLWSEAVPCSSGTCVDGVCEGCTPECTGKSCGSDGCGGSCGTCPDGGACDAGVCGGCVPECGDAECGPDGCGGSCGLCDAGLACQEGSCDCVPQCDGKECGDDGCGGACGICLGDFSCSELGECVPEAYRAILIQGHWTAGVGCSQYNSTGADIDAVELRAADGETVSYFIEVIEEVGVDQCDNNYTNPESSIGPPNDDYMALQGGWIMGRFADYVPVTSGMSLVIYESYSAEPYSIYLVTGFDCAESDDPGACSVLLTDQASGSVEVAIP